MAWPNILHRIVQDAELRRVPVLQDDFQAPVVVQVGESERAAVVGKIQSDRAGDFGKRAIAIVGVEHVSLGAAP